MLQQSCQRLGTRRGGAARHAIVAAAAKTAGKGFGNKPLKQEDDRKPGTDKRVAREAASGAAKARPVRPEEAARGKLDYVQVADWGDGNRSKLGELKMVSHVTTYEGSAAAAAAAAAVAGATGGPGEAGAAAGAAAGRGGAGATGAAAGADRRPFHTQLAHQLKMAEARGALAVAGPPPPPPSQWSWREGRYRQYLADLAEVHTALEAALTEATSSAASTSGGGGSGSGAAAAPQQSPHAALAHLRPGRLGLERAASLRRDLAALLATAEQAPEAVAAAERHSSGVEASSSSSAAAGAALGGKGKAAPAPAGAGAGTGSAVAAAPPAAGPMARSYGQVLSRLGRVAAAGETEQERQGAALRLLAHAGVLHLVGQAAWTALGATATERLALLPRRAAAAYHDYPEQVRDPRVTLAAALDAAGSHLSSRPEWVQAVFEEVSGAMTKTSLLLTALAHRD